jgi:ABC-type Fe3+-hydroxamate transport system substrate-binding protein
MIAGEESPDAGELRVGETVELAYVDQARGDLDPESTVWKEISAATTRSSSAARGELAAVRLVVQLPRRRPAEARRRPVGGERNRVHLAKLLRSGGNVLLLDEPTNDLDVDTLRALEDALLDFAGCAVVISHDRWFLDRIATHILAFEGDSQVTWFEGSWAEYAEWVTRRAAPRRSSRTGSSTSRSSAPDLGAPTCAGTTVRRMRVVSLLPSATEIVAELGLDRLLVGRSEECDWPPSVEALPSSALQGSTRGPSPPARSTTPSGRRSPTGGRSTPLDQELLAALAPDLVLTQDLCAMCAVASGDLCLVDVPTLALDPRTLEEVAASVETVAAALGEPERGQARAERMRAELAQVRAATVGLPRVPRLPAEWVDPPYAPGHWLPELVDVAGGTCVLGRAGAHSVRTTWEAARAARPELVVLAPCGYDAERAALEPVPDGLGCRVVAVDGSAFYAAAGAAAGRGRTTARAPAPPRCRPRSGPAVLRRHAGPAF